MRLARLLSGLAFAMVFAVAVDAQQARADLMRQRMEAGAKGAPGWFHDGFELVLAEADFDLHQAQATAQQLWDVAQQAPDSTAQDSTAPAGTAATCAAVMGYIVTRLDGPAQAAPWRTRVEQLPAPTDPVLSAYQQLARGWQYCAVGDHVAELKCGLAAQDCAELAADEVLRVRAVMATMHGRPGRGLESLERAFAAADQRGHGAEVEFLRLQLAFLELQRARQEGNQPDIDRLMGEIDTRAVASGNQRMSAALEAFRVGLLFDGKNAAAAMQGYAEVVSRFQKLGDRFDTATALDLRAWLAVRCDQLDLAKKLVQACQQLIEGRGMVDAEKEVLQTRFELAVRSKDADAAEKLSHALDQTSRERFDEEQQLAVVREQLRVSEEAKRVAERQLLESQQRVARRAWRSQWYAGIGAMLALATIAAIAWFSRRRLLFANTQLEDRVREVEQARAAQAKLEARLRQMERTEGLGTMAAGIAHDFNNLLTSMIGGAELLEYQLRDEGQRELTGLILSAGRQGARLCKQLQAYAGGTPPAPTSNDLLEVVRDMLPTLRASVGAAVDVRLTIDSGPAIAAVDRGQFEQVMLNLVQNSREASAGSVRIRVRAATDESSGTAVENGASVEVVDDGRGMEDDVAQRIFDPFFTTKFPGRGLGLAVVHGGIRRHGGTVNVRSKVGEGTTFAIWLPVGVPSAAATRDPHEAVAFGVVPADLGVLVVDDEPSVRQVLATFLRQMGLEVKIAATGEEALALAKTFPAERLVVAFVDLTMPGMDGFEVVARLRAEAPVPKIVMMSGHAGSELERIAQEAGADGSLSKPFLLGDVRIVLAAVCADRGEARSLGSASQS